MLGFARSGDIDMRAHTKVLSALRPDTPDSRGQVISGPQTAWFIVKLCGAGSSPPDMSTAVARAFEEKSSALPTDSGTWAAVYSGV
jgi:hypothetical protein